MWVDRFRDSRNDPGMTCKQYRQDRKKKISQAELARRAGEHQSVIANLELGRDITGRKWAKIMKATNGKVNPVAEYGEELDL